MSALTLDYRLIKSDKLFRQTVMLGQASDPDLINFLSLDFELASQNSRAFTFNEKLYLHIDGTLVMHIDKGQQLLQNLSASGFVAIPGECVVTLVNNSSGDTARSVRVQAVVANKQT